jgi:hypothetical protein
MPYFHKPTINLNLLFIHIPKTGGNSLEKYFSQKYDIPLCLNTLCSPLRNGFTKNDISLQHQTLIDIYKEKNFFKINFTPDIKIIAVVRNPYERIISDLFFFQYINKNSSQEEVFTVINNYLLTDVKILDNHSIPQYKFVTDENGLLIDNIHILKLEQLNSDMYDLGYHDFNFHENKNQENINCFSYLNMNSIYLINKIYEKDFLLFNYKMKFLKNII